MNLDKETLDIISGMCVVISGIPYAWGVWREKTVPNIVSWSLWTIIGFAILLTYTSSSSKSNVWPALFGFINPLVIAILAIVKKRERAMLSGLEWVCIFTCFVSLAMWMILRSNLELMQYALYTALVADACAATPTVRHVFENPEEERPAPWGIFALANVLALFAVPEQTYANYVLPTYMLIASSIITLPLVVVRIKKRTPLREWI